jgi:hypothetical protein
MLFFVQRYVIYPSRNCQLSPPQLKFTEQLKLYSVNPLVTFTLKIFG